VQNTSPLLQSINVTRAVAVVMTFGCIVVLPLIAVAGGNEPSKPMPTPAPPPVAPSVPLTLPTLQPNGLLLENQEIVGWNVPNRLIVERPGIGVLMGLTQTNGRFSAVLPGFVEDPRPITEALGITECTEVVTSPASLRTALFIQFSILNTTDEAQISKAQASGSLTLSDSAASAIAIGGNTPPDKGRYIVYIYATEVGTINGSCPSSSSDFSAMFNMKLNLKSGWNTTVLDVLKRDTIYDFNINNIANTDGFKWYFTKP
jgi:hypothetical protein